MKKYKIFWAVGREENEEIIEAESLEEAKEEAYASIDRMEKED